MIASPIWGALSDRFGRKVMVVRSSFGGALLLFLMAFVRSAEELVLMRAIQGFITGTVAAANALVAAEAPREHTGYAMGMLQVGLGAGIALGPLIGGTIADLFGYRAAFYVTAAMLFLSSIIVWFGVEEKFDPTELLAEDKISFFGEWQHILKASGVFITYSLRFVSQLGRMMITPIIPLFIMALMPLTTHINTFTGLVIGVASVTTTISAIYLGRLGDRIGHRRIVLVCMFVAALLYLPQSLVNNGWQLFILQGLVGIAMGGIIPAISALLAKFTQPGEEGAVYGLDNSVNSAARTLAPLLGASVAMWFDLRATFIATAFLFLVSAVIVAWRLPQVNQNNTK